MNLQIKIITATITIVLGIVTPSSSAGIWTDPNNFDVNTLEGTTLEGTLTIGNDGVEDLDFIIRTRQSSTTRGINYDTTVSDKRTVSSSIPAHHDFTKINRNASYRPGKLIVRFAQKSSGRSCSRKEKNEILRSLGGATITREFQTVPGLSVVELPTGMTVEEALLAFNNTDGILYAEPDYEVTLNSTIPNDTGFDELWGMHNTGQNDGTIDADIDAPEAWDISTGSSDIIVAVIDTGVDYTHPDLAVNMWVNEGEIPDNGLDDDGNGYIDDIYGYDFRNDDGDPWDDHYHGTHCAGTIGAIGNNGRGVAGVCWSVRIMALKFLSSGGSGWTSDAIKCVDYSMIMGANLSSNSWGGSGYGQGLEDAINAAGVAGMLFVAAAGNDNEDTDVQPHYPSSYDCESLISVMATDKNDKKSSFSNYGLASVDLGAPGSRILSCEPGNQYQYLSGTSMATPHVAGSCALLWSMNQSISNSEIKDILLQTVDEALPGLCVSQGRLNVYSAILETRVPWIIIEPEEGTIGPGDSNDVSVTFSAIGLTPGIYEAEIVVISDDPCSPAVIPVTMTVNPDDLQVTPIEGFELSGTRGGPFTPECMTYTLTSNGPAAVSWTIDETEGLVAIEPNAGVLDPNDSIDVNVCITPDANLLDPNIYYHMLMFENTNSGSIKPRLVTLTVKPPDCFTERFYENIDLEFLSLTFSPDGTSAYYEACREKVDEFFTDPNGGMYVPLWDDDFVEIVLNNDTNVLFYGTRYDRFYIGSNGYITFEQGDTEFSATLENHFDAPRISAMFTDLTPADGHSVTCKQLEDRIAVTFEEVPLYGDKTAKNNFQVEMFFADGTIRITWLAIAPAAGVAGLSEGYDLPPFFLESNLKGYDYCWPWCDLNRDYYVNFKDFAVLAEHWLEEDCTIPFWCRKTDMDFSSTVDYDDLSICAKNWLAADEWWLQPISYWKFDEGSGRTAYDSAGSNDGTVYGATWTTGKIDGALSFDGGEDYVFVGDKSVLEQQEFTLSYWAKLDNPSGSLQGGIAKGRIFGTPYMYSYLLDFHIGDARAGVSNTTSTAFTTTYPIGDSNWHMWSMTVGDGTLTLYKDGVFVNSTEYTGTIDYFKSYNSFVIGARENGDYAFDGKIDDVRFYDIALSTEEIWQLYQQGLGPKASKPNPSDGATAVNSNTVLSWLPGKDAVTHDVYLGTDYGDVNDADIGSPEYMGNFDVNNFDPCGLDTNTTYYWRIDELDGSGTAKGDIWSFTTWGDANSYLVSWWKFDEGSGSTAYDSAGSNNGTVYGATWTTGKIDGALSFDGGEDYVFVGDKSVLEQQEFTLSYWAKLDNPSGSLQGGIAKGRIFGTPYMYSYLLDFHIGDARAGVSNTTSTAFTTTYPIGDSNWHMWSMTVGDGTLTLYKDGVFVNSTEYTGTIDYFKSYNSFVIGARENGDYAFDGKIDDVRFYYRVLSAQEIELLYQESL